MKLRPYLGHLADVLGTTPADLHQLQRILGLDPEAQAAGFRPERPGPGGGIEATPPNVTRFLIAAMAGGARTDATRTVWEAWHRNHVAGPGSGALTFRFDDGSEHRVPACPLTRRNLFGDALVRILADRKVAALVASVTVRRDLPLATINYTDKAGDPRESRFGEETDHRSALVVSAALPGAALVRIAEDIAE